MTNMPSEVRSTDSDQLVKQQAIQALQLAQVTDDYQKLVKKVAGPLYDDVAAVFPDHLQMLYLLTNVRRRQVWNAVLATDRISGKTTERRKRIVALRHALLSHKSADLLTQAYGGTPPGFEGMLSRLGFVAQDRDTYSKLFALAHDGPRLRRQLLQEKHLTSQAIHRLSTLPKDLRCLHFAKSFNCDDDVQTFVEIYGELKATNFSDWKELKEQLQTTVRQRRNVSTIIRSMYVRLPFPPQHVPNCDRVRFLSNGLAMEVAAKRYRNCLSNLVPQAVRGDVQFYEWRGRAHAIVALVWHRNRWKIDEIKMKGNRKPAKHLRENIFAHFARHGVSDTPDLPQMLEKFLLAEAFDFDEPGMPFEDMSFDMSYALSAA